MSNSKKRAIKSELERMFLKNGISSFEKDVMRKLQRYVADGHPFDKKQQEAYFSGALYGYEVRNQMWQTKALYMLCGSAITLLLTAFYVIFKSLVS